MLSLAHGWVHYKLDETMGTNVWGAVKVNGLSLAHVVKPYDVSKPCSEEKGCTAGRVKSVRHKRLAAIVLQRFVYRMQLKVPRGDGQAAAWNCVGTSVAFLNILQPFVTSSLKQFHQPKQKKYMGDSYSRSLRTVPLLLLHIIFHRNIKYKLVQLHVFISPYPNVL